MSWWQFELNMTSDEKVWRVLDLYCCAGGSAKGYELGGFNEIIGVDQVKKKEYPYFFIKADIEDFIYEKPVEWFESFDLISASPPCQFHSKTKHLAIAQGNLPSDIDHLPMIRQFLKSLDVEYVIENVPEAWDKEERKKITYSCGSHFGLGVQRHRYFEASFPIEQLKCDHNSPHWPIGPKGKPNQSVSTVAKETKSKVCATKQEKCKRAVGLQRQSKRHNKQWESPISPHGETCVKRFRLHTLSTFQVLLQAHGGKRSRNLEHSKEEYIKCRSSNSVLLNMTLRDHVAERVEEARKFGEYVAEQMEGIGFRIEYTMNGKESLLFTQDKDRQPIPMYKSNNGIEE